MVMHGCHLSYTGNDKKIVVQTGQGIKQDFVSKLINAKSAGGVAQVLGHLPGKHKSLS
jgi:hypothetical protein